MSMLQRNICVMKSITNVHAEPDFAGKEMNNHNGNIVLGKPCTNSTPAGKAEGSTLMLEKTAPASNVTSTDMCPDSIVSGEHILPLDSLGLKTFLLWQGVSG